VDHLVKKHKRRAKRKKRIKKKILGTAGRPRLSVYRSLNHFYVQLIDDSESSTLLGLSTLSKELKENIGKTGNADAARKLGELVAQRAIEKNIKQVVFDRNGFLYHGRVKALAEGARSKGLKF
jgi:large subunit ribosomal protein L18